MTGEAGGNHGPGRGRLRSTLLAAAGAAALAGLAACGVQPTGVHINAGGPVTLDPSSPTSSASDSGSGQYTFVLFLSRGRSTNLVTPVMRSADHELSPAELLDALGYVNEDEVSDGYATYVPPSLSSHLAPTKQKHQYQSMESLDSSAVTQVVCTLDLYWMAHPDPDPRIQDSTEIFAPGISNPIWDDCSTQPGFVEALAKVKEGMVAQSGFEGAAPVPTVSMEPSTAASDRLAKPKSP